ncbi:MAG: hypothetical protein WCF18_24535 [Chthoniobacteraceae bacterium]
MKKTSKLAPAANKQTISKRHHGIESLESRIAPAAIATPITFSYTDGDGDVVQVQVTGNSGTVEFLDALGGDVHANGGDISKIIITKPSADFAISFADTNSPTGANLGDNVIDLGTILGAANTRVPVIKGIFTADSTPSVAYKLGGYLGTDFAPGGGLGIVGQVVGDSVGATTDVDLLSLGKGTSISFGGVDAGATVQISGKVMGNLSTPVLDGDLSLGTVSGRIQIGHIGGTLTVQSDFGGRLDLGDPDALGAVALEEVTIKGSVLGAGVIHATQDLALHVTKDLSGAVLTGGSLDAEVGGAMKGARIVAGDDLTLNVTGAVADSSIVAQHLVQLGSIFKKGMSNSSIVGGTGLNLDVTGSVAKSRFSGGTGSLNVNISGKVAGSQFLAGGDADVTTGFSVDGSSILPDGRLTLTVGAPPQGVVPGVGDVTKSIIGSKSTSATVNIGGKVSGSQFTTGTDLDLTVGKSLVGSGVQAANDLTIDVSTNVMGTRIAVGSDADVTIGGQLAASSLIVSNNLDAQIGPIGQTIGKGGNVSAGIIKSRLETSDGSMVVAAVGPISGSVLDSGQHVTVSVDDLIGKDPVTGIFKVLKPGSIGADVTVNAPADVSVKTTGIGRVAARITAGRDAVVNVAGAFSGSMTVANELNFHAKSVALAAKGSVRVGGDLTFMVTGDVAAPSIDVAGNVRDFHVGGALNGGINIAGNFVAGTTTAAATVIGGAVGASTFLHIGGDLGSESAAPEFVFGKGFGGRLEVGGNVLTDLTFQGDVGRIAIDGCVGAATPVAPLAPVAPVDGTDIIVKGKLGSFKSSSLFHRLTDKGGNFVDGANATTGALQADGGAPLIGPFLI